MPVYTRRTSLLPASEILRQNHGRSAPLLPPEIWQLIIDSSHWSRTELRSPRLTCKSSQQAVTTLVFESVLLRPNSDSLTRARKISRASHLAFHVQRMAMRGDKIDDHVYIACDFEEAVRRRRKLAARHKAALIDNAAQYAEGWPALARKQNLSSGCYNP